MADSAPEREIKRRDFLDYILGGSIVGFLISVFYPVIAYLKPPKVSEAIVSSVKVGSIDEIPLNTSRMVKFGNKPAIVVRTPGDELKAYIAICTHLDCTVQHKPEDNILWCACHNGRYDLNGINIAGPPPRPLEPLRVSIKDQEIYISRES
jgi:Rieske Fe-S protein